jgi:recombination protein RecA
MPRKRTRNEEDSTVSVKSSLKQHSETEVDMTIKEYDGDFGTKISTGSTLLDLAISGGRVRGGGVPFGILVEIFGPSGSGKTVLLSELAGGVQRLKGDTMFYDPEARLNKQFSRMFGFELDPKKYETPDTVTKLFESVRKWEPDRKSKANACFADSLAALSTDLEMDNDEGDKMGMRRAKEFSQELRKTCRFLKDSNYLLVCSNQVRDNPDAVGPYAQKETTPGGKAIPFYASLRLRFFKPQKIRKTKKIAGKDVKRVVGVESQVEVYKSSIWKPFAIAPVTIIFDYGIDDIRQNLQYLKTYTGSSSYVLGEENLGKTIDGAISVIEKENREKELKEEVIDLWTEIEEKFNTERVPKRWQ